MFTDEPLTSLLDELKDTEEPIRARLVYRLSDATPEDILTLTAQWGSVPVDRRRAFVRRLLDTSETTFDVDYATVARLLLNDDDAEVRALAARTLWTDESVQCMRLLITVLQEDPSPAVRGAAAQGLGRFVLKGELGELRREVTKAAEEALLAAHNPDEELIVQRRTLESIAFAGREDVPPLISRAATHPELEMRASAIFAMGRSADERWAGDVMNALHEEENMLRFEAARAAGELMLESAVRRLIAMLGGHDTEIKTAAIWSLGEIGGDDAQEALQRLLQNETDEAIIEVAEDALNMAMLTNGEFGTILLESDGYEEDDFDLY